MELSKRLSAVACLVDRCGCAADIGTDHGYVPIFLVESGIADRVIVMNDGRVDLDGTPQEVFSQVTRLRHLGLTAPDTVDLLDRLRQKGWDVPLDALRAEDCAAAIAGALKNE